MLYCFSIIQSTTEDKAKIQVSAKPLVNDDGSNHFPEFSRFVLLFPCFVSRFIFSLVQFWSKCKDGSVIWNGNPMPQQRRRGTESPYGPTGFASPSSIVPRDKQLVPSFWNSSVCCLGSLLFCPKGQGVEQAGLTLDQNWCVSIHAPVYGTYTHTSRMDILLRKRAALLEVDRQWNSKWKWELLILLSVL